MRVLGFDVCITDRRFARCYRCKKRKQVSEFYSAPSRSSGVPSSCKDCQNKANKEWRDAHTQHIREKNRAYRLKGKE